jgi:peptidoglycan-associated lipoprotein
MRRSSIFALSVLLVFPLACGKKDVKAEESVAPAAQAPEPTPPPPVDEANDLKTVNFAFDKADLTPEAKSLLKQNVKWLKANPTAVVQIEGNCDERGSTDYNFQLGNRRATTVKRYLTHHGIKSKRITTISYGKDHPLDPGHDESAWAKNRRAAFRLNAK